MKRDIKLYIKDIIDAMEAIEKFVEGFSYEDFVKDDKTASAVIRKFEIIGEAAKYLPENFKEIYPDIPWKEMAGFRNKLIHLYFGIKYDIVWNTIKIELPKIKPKLKDILSQLEGKEEK